MAKELKDVTKAEDNYSQWYNDLVVKAGLAENSAVRGCMVINLTLCHLGENAGGLDKMFKDTGHQNAYFPLFHPQVVSSRKRPTTWKLCQGVRRGHPLPLKTIPRQGRRGRSRCQTRRGADRPSHLGNDHLEHLQGLDPVLPRPADPLQPVGERRTLGNAHPPVPAHGRNFSGRRATRPMPRRRRPSRRLPG